MVRSGRLANTEREMILDAIGNKAREKFNDILDSNNHSYNLGLFKNILYWEKDINEFKNIYYMKGETEEITKLAYYFEYGTGLYNTKLRTSGRDRIYPKIADRFVFRKPWKGIKGARSVSGVRPIFMMTKSVKYVEQNQDILLREIRIELGI